MDLVDVFKILIDHVHVNEDTRSEMHDVVRSFEVSTDEPRISIELNPPYHFKELPEGA